MKVLKQIKNYLFVFFISIIILLITTTIFLKSTILNYNFVLNIIEKDNYYNKLYDDIYEEMLNNIPSSGFDKVILENLFTIEDLKQDTENIIIDFYSNEKIENHNERLKSKLNTNINKYIKDNKLVVESQNDINRYVNIMIEVYKKNIIPGSVIEQAEKSFKMINIIVTITLILSIISLLVIIIYKRKELYKSYSILLLFTSFVYIFIYFYIKNHVDISNLMFYNNSLSSIVKSIINNLLSRLLIITIIYFILSIIIEIIIKKKHLK